MIRKEQNRGRENKRKYVIEMLRDDMFELFTYQRKRESMQSDDQRDNEYIRHTFQDSFEI